MASFVDPTSALNQLQNQLENKQLPLDRSSPRSDLFVLRDEPNQKPRFTYLSTEKNTIKSIAMFVLVEPYKGLPCFQIGYAVAESYRNHGLATQTVKAAINELIHGLSVHNITPIYLEAVVQADNTVSQRVMEKTLTGDFVEIIDSFSGAKCHLYRSQVAQD